MRKHALLLAACCLLLAGCADYAVIGEKRPRVLPPPAGTGPLARVENSIGRALREGTGHPRAALGNYLAALDAASRQLESAPDNAIARRDYNFALARVFTLIRDARLEPWSKPLPVGDYTLVPPAVPPGRPEWSPDLYEFLPADQLVVRGTYVTKRIVKDGIGAPLVARRAEARADARAEFVMDRPYYGVTALARFEGNRCFLSFADPLAPEEVKVGSRKFPLAADYTAPLAVMLADTRPKKLELVRLLRPEKFAETAQITRLQPYAPKKTVVICVHGLMDSPATWIPLLNELRGDKEIRAHYQFWFYSYPSGYPYPYSAAIFRRELDAVEKKLQVRKPIVLIGHSMGGIIGRLMVTDSGDSIWLSLFGKKPAQTPLSNHARKLLTESLIFNHRPEVGRVIFIAAPHRGSHLASNWLGRLGSSLVKGPRTLVAMGKEIRHVLTLDVGALKMDRIPNSVDTLAPNNRFVKAINKVPLTCGIPYHTIAGDRGRGDTPNSSDGVVPYWSSHLEGAESELIVPSSHSAHQNPQAIQEVLRILKRHEQ